jgi:hypothetical protein
LRRWFDGSAIEADDACAAARGACAKGRQQRGFSDARDTVDVRHQRPVLFEDVEKGLHLALASRAQRTPPVTAAVMWEWARVVPISVSRSLAARS